MSEYVGDVFFYMEKAERLRAMLARFEWSGSVQGQGSGPMGSGGNGRAYGACPACRGIHPSGRAEFIDEAIGHKGNCELFLAINGIPLTSTQRDSLARVR